MATKKITVKNKHKDEKITEMLHFGYRAIDINEGDKKSVITFGRDLDVDDKTLLALEKEYNMITNPFPKLGAFFLALGVALIIANYMLSSMPVPQLICLILGILSVGIGTFLVVVFICTKAFKKKLVDKLFLRGDRYQGIVRDYPISKNLEPANDLSGTIRKNIDDILD